MSSIRSFEKEDIPAVTEIFKSLFLKENRSRRSLPASALNDHFEDIFFNNPWYDSEITSLVSESREGRINGFLGVVPREMNFSGRPIRMAVSLYHMVDPESRSTMVGIHLLKRFFAGPQDLSLTDGAGDIGRRVWMGAGGSQAPLYSLQWERILKPVRLGVEFLARPRLLSFSEPLLSPLASLSDSVATRFMPGSLQKIETGCSEEDLDLKTMIDLIPVFYQPGLLLPVYREETLQWILDQAGRLRLHGDLKKVMVRNAEREVIGWFLYYAAAGKRCPVLHVAAKRGEMHVILNHLFHHANRHGVTALFGWINPRNIQDIADHYCYFRLGAWTLIHSRHRELINIFQSGEASISKLDGEWFLHF